MNNYQKELAKPQNKIYNKIQILDEQTSGKIAAGEVIERPANVLKELLENAIDSGATIINIEIEDAGKKLIRVNDNGNGMGKEDLKLSVVRHATSKISNFNDLDTLNTFGFRGEALYSVSAVSKLTISSGNGKEASKILIEGGKFKSQSASPNIKGTTVEVRDLFYNFTPRLNFLKSDNVERSHLLKVVEECALANLDISFNVKTNGREVYTLKAHASKDIQTKILARAQEILGESVSKNLKFIEHKFLNFKACFLPVDSMISTRNLQFFFTNRRPVTSKIFQQALYNAYKDFRQSNKHPACVIYLEMDPSEFDVNIHPQKREISFIDSSSIYNLVKNKLAEALLPKQVKETNLGEEPKNLEQTLDSFKPLKSELDGKVPDAVVHKSFESKQNAVRDFEEAEVYKAQQKAPQKEENLTFEPETKQKHWHKPPYEYKGQISKTFLLFENPDGLIVMDQHAAQERVLFEKYLKELNNKKVSVQKLMFDVLVKLPASSVDNIMGWREFFKKAGFDISQASYAVLKINSYPNVFKFNESEITDLFTSLSELLADPKSVTDEIKKNTIALFSCKKSVKANQALSKKEAEVLIESLKTCSDGLHCPHGRPTMISFTAKDLYKKFGRI
ncbi:MAG: DNA mismatch repair endonuclease MutL [Elusimicrobiaceae bacterium]|jgi:DNA mismatch repair protein MutL|nr:DNA mismatch repair endonuclease MutL [Elusimicrobiaceae bacterium]MBT3954897.1 DNA mismatch repair endonuclease MutL [Elusimicrobiaceae bacterium]MBT4008031.1 DNA mismatch repair endonuclease MutL [Elusimicrobiaceae bacterium]MBT4403176.1 DNA mismatch repair endonuclease MutL [Elusimicrobiaceae bacterium]MBT4439687.1 DNA mismatch repair endonuclease MutL [Elusimicrobiaceae bacterium]